MFKNRFVFATFLGSVLLATAQPERVTVDFEWVARLAAELIQNEGPLASPELPAELKSLTYDDYRNIRFRSSEALWWNDPLPFRVEFFHLGHIFKDSVSIYEASDTHVQEVPFLPTAFNYERSGYTPNLKTSPKGYAGIRVKAPLNRSDVFDDLIVFQGASYFRALGQNQVYGLSLRGLSMNTTGDAETFPRFTKIWLKKPKRDETALTIYALLEGAKVTGAYAFKIQPSGRTDIEVRARLFFRNGGEKEVGLAPMTSMFLFGENSRDNFSDWRPQVHDSDGLLIHADQEWTWHALDNLPGRNIRVFPAAKLRGFGLMQRDRNFANFKDLEARYELRPSAWIEPKGKWPAGAVVLYNFGVDAETIDNVNAFWKPDLAEGPEGPLDLHYTIALQLTDPPSELAKVVETRIGQRTLDPSATTIVIEFSRPESIRIDEIGDLSVNFQFGEAAMLDSPVIQYNAPEDRIRVFANFKNPPADAPQRPFDLYAQLLRKGHQVSERWSYTWKP